MVTLPFSHLTQYTIAEEQFYYKQHICFLAEEELLPRAAAEESSSEDETQKDPEEGAAPPPAKKRLWARSWILQKEKGHYDQLLPELRADDPKSYKNFLRMDHTLFSEIMERITPRIEKKDTTMRHAISSGQRLAITLRYLATGDSYQSMQYNFRVAANTISGIIPATCDAIIAEFMPEVLTCPSTEEEWKNVADYFSKRWQFHNCLGAVDGKHVAIKCPHCGGSLYYNYKGFHSIVLMALVDANYRFLYVDVGANGSCSDGGVFKDTSLYDALENGRAGVPEPLPLPGDTEDVHYALIADDAFATRIWLMKPFPHRGLDHDERVLNYRLSRARRVVENAFGILAHRFRCLLSVMQIKPENVLKVVMAACVLHNLISLRNPRQITYLADTEDTGSGQLIRGQWREELGDDILADLESIPRNTSTKAAKLQRNYLKVYYINVGAVPWQEEFIREGHTF